MDPGDLQDTIDNPYSNGRNDFELFAAFIDFITFSSDAVFREQIGSWLNVDGMLRVMAVDMATGDWDTYWIRLH